MKKLIFALFFVCFGALYAEDSVLIVVNSNSAASLEVAKYYAKKRKVHESYICKINFSSTETVPYKEYIETIIPEIKSSIKSSTKNILMSYETPYILMAVSESNNLGGRYSMDHFIRFLFDKSDETTLLSYYYDSYGNVFFEKAMTMTNTMKNYNVTRLDGPSPAAARALVDRAMYAEQIIGPKYGKAYFDWKGVTDAMNVDFSTDSDINRTSQYVKGLGYEIVTEPTTEDFGKGKCPSTLFYYGRVDAATYQDAFEWLPGSVGLCAQYDCYDIRSDKSWVANALRKGMTACVCAIDQLKNPRFVDGAGFFKEFTKGTPFGETVYKSMPSTRYNLIIIGDPLFRVNASWGKKNPPKILKAEYYPDNDAPEGTGAIMVETDVYSYAKIEYGKDGKYDQVYESNTLALKHKMIIDYVAGKTYSYKLACTDAFKAVSPKADKFITPAASLAKVLNVTASSKGGEVGLSWEKPKDILPAGYKIYRRPADYDFYELVGETAKDITVFTDKKVENGTSYVYNVRVFDEKGNISKKSEVFARPTPLLAVEGLKAEIKTTCVLLSWKKIPAKEVVAYKVFKSTTPTGKYKEVKRTINPDFSDYNVRKGDLLFYKIMTIGAGDESGSETAPLKVNF